MQWKKCGLTEDSKFISPWLHSLVPPHSWGRISRKWWMHFVLKCSRCPLEAFLPKRSVLELFITLLWYSPPAFWKLDPMMKKPGRWIEMSWKLMLFLYLYIKELSLPSAEKCWQLAEEKTPVAQKWRTTLFPPKWSGVIKLYLFEIKRDFIDRTVYWFISLLLLPFGRCASLWAESVESRGSAPALWTKCGVWNLLQGSTQRREELCSLPVSDAQIQLGKTPWTAGGQFC